VEASGPASQEVEDWAEAGGGGVDGGGGEYGGGLVGSGAGRRGREDHCRTGSLYGEGTSTESKDHSVLEFVERMRRHV